LNAICEDIEMFCNIFLDTYRWYQHGDTIGLVNRYSRIKRDNDDVNKIIEWLRIHNPFPRTNKIMSLPNGTTGIDEIITVMMLISYNLGLMNSMVG